MPISNSGPRRWQEPKIRQALAVAETAPCPRYLVNANPNPPAGSARRCERARSEVCNALHAWLAVGGSRAVLSSGPATTNCRRRGECHRCRVQCHGGPRVRAVRARAAVADRGPGPGGAPGPALGDGDGGREAEAALLVAWVRKAVFQGELWETLACAQWRASLCLLDLWRKVCSKGQPLVARSSTRKSVRILLSCLQQRVCLKKGLRSARAETLGRENCQVHSLLGNICRQD